MQSLEELLDVSKQRVASRKDIKALRTKAAAEQRAKLTVGEQRVKLPKKKPEQIEKDKNNLRISRVDFRISADESAFSILNTNPANNRTHTSEGSGERNVRLGEMSFEEETNGDARNCKILNELQQKMGNKLCEISSHFEGCSRSAVKNRWCLINRNIYISQTSLRSEFCTPTLSEPVELKISAENSALGIGGLSLMDDFAHGDLQLNTSVSALSAPQFFADERLACNFHRQHQYHKERDPFRMEPFDWSAVLLELGPGHVPIYKFENNTRSVIWPKVETTILTIDNIGFGLLWTILSEEFGWRHFPGSGGCVNDSFKSPVSDVEHFCEFYGNAIDLRLHVKIHGLYGNNNVLMTTSFCFALVNKEGHEMTTLTICKTPLLMPTMTSDESVQFEPIYLSSVCEDEYICFCCDGLMRIGDGSNEKTYC
jgi:hypothetical protein